jgi:hypothetical protein
MQDCKNKHAYILSLFNEAICGIYVIPITPINDTCTKEFWNMQQQTSLTNGGTVYLKTPMAEFNRWLHTYSQK